MFQFILAATLSFYSRCLHYLLCWGLKIRHLAPCFLISKMQNLRHIQFLLSQPYWAEFLFYCYTHKSLFDLFTTPHQYHKSCPPPLHAYSAAFLFFDDTASFFKEFMRLGRRSRTRVFDDRVLYDARIHNTVTMKTTCTDKKHTKWWAGAPHLENTTNRVLLSLVAKTQLNHWTKWVVKTQLLLVIA